MWGFIHTSQKNAEKEESGEVEKEEEEGKRRKREIRRGRERERETDNSTPRTQGNYGGTQAFGHALRFVEGSNKLGQACDLSVEQQ
ncbi:hypothetical protein Scep_019269 [Stephania cephalantha]|uniref:Uncharacterized protein n=1 Tax=Stephania cephalantha TaxID=152367 RepID=A0AAP0IAU9_9MAGN